MLTYFVFRFFATLFGASFGDTPVSPTSPVVVQLEKVETTRVAQVRLAEVLGAADGIHGVTVKGNQVSFVINRDEQVFRVVASTRKGEVMALSIIPVSDHGMELGGGLSWLASELEGATAVTRLVANEDGAVTITTNDNRRYMAIPGRGSGGNAAVEARWAAAWDHEG